MWPGQENQPLDHVGTLVHVYKHTILKYTTPHNFCLLDGNHIKFKPEVQQGNIQLVIIQKY